jgi:hypothetical protein
MDEDFSPVDFDIMAYLVLIMNWNCHALDGSI